MKMQKLFDEQSFNQRQEQIINRRMENFKSQINQGDIKIHLRKVDNQPKKRIKLRNFS